MSPPCPLKSFCLPSYRTLAWPGPVLSSSSISYIYFFVGSFDPEPYDVIQLRGSRNPAPCISQVVGTAGAQLVIWLTASHLPPVTLGSRCFFTLLEDPKADGMVSSLQVSQTTWLEDGEKLALKVVLWPPHISHSMHKVIKIPEKTLNLFIFLKYIYIYWTKNNFISKFARRIKTTHT